MMIESTKFCTSFIELHIKHSLSVFFVPECHIFFKILASLNKVNIHVCMIFSFPSNFALYSKLSICDHSWHFGWPDNLSVFFMLTNGIAKWYMYIWKASKFLPKYIYIVYRKNEVICHWIDFEDFLENNEMWDPFCIWTEIWALLANNGLGNNEVLVHILNSCCLTLGLLNLNQWTLNKYEFYSLFYHWA